MLFFDFITLSHCIFYMEGPSLLDMANIYSSLRSISSKPHLMDEIYLDCLLQVSWPVLSHFIRTPSTNSLHVCTFSSTISTRKRHSLWSEPYQVLYSSRMCLEQRSAQKIFSKWINEQTGRCWSYFTFWLIPLKFSFISALVGNIWILCTPTVFCAVVLITQYYHCLSCIAPTLPCKLPWEQMSQVPNIVPI